MAFRFQTGKPAGAEVLRVVREQMRRAAKAAANKRGPLGERVHVARTSAKKIRAALLLVRSTCPGWWAREDTFFQAAARRLAPCRDAMVLTTTFDALAREADAKHRRGTAALRRKLALYSRNLLEQYDEAAPALAAVARDMRPARARLSGRAIEVKDWATLWTGFGETYRRARRWSHRAKLDAPGHVFHRWRRHVKAHGYHYHLFRDAWPAVMCEWQAKLGALADLLGDEHDLAMLEDWFAELPRAARDAEPVRYFRARAAARRQELRKQAIKLGERLFSEKPGAVVRRLPAWWCARS